MAQVGKVGAASKSNDEETAAVVSSSPANSNLNNDYGEISQRTTQARDDVTPTMSKANFPARDPSSSCRTSSSSWAVGKIAGNLSPEAIFGEGEDLVPMPLEESVFSSESGEQFELADAPIGNEADNTAPTNGTCTSGPSKGKDIISLTKHQKRKAESRNEDSSLIHVIEVDEFLQRGDHASKYDNYQLLAEPCEEPTERDVLLGRGGLTNHHRGNKLYREKIEDFKPHYQKLSSKEEKQEFSKMVVNFVHSYGGRFLEKDVYSDGWVEVEKNKARKKVGQALREELKR